MLALTELTGLRRKITLTDRALPYQGVSYPGRQEVSRVDYLGSRVATLQVLGGREGPLEFNGRWKDRYIGDSVTIEGFDDIRSPPLARDLVRAAQRIRIGGQLVRVEWEDQIRVGVVVQFEPTYDRIEDIGWRLRIEVAAAGSTPVAHRASVVPGPSSEPWEAQIQLDDLLGGVGFLEPLAQERALVSAADAVRDASDSYRR